MINRVIRSNLDPVHYIRKCLFTGLGFAQTCPFSTVSPPHCLDQNLVYASLYNVKFGLLVSAYIPQVRREVKVYSVSMFIRLSLLPSIYVTRVTPNLFIPNVRVPSVCFGFVWWGPFS